MGNNRTCSWPVKNCYCVSPARFNRKNKTKLTGTKAFSPKRALFRDTEFQSFGNLWNPCKRLPSSLRSTQTVLSPRPGPPPQLRPVWCLVPRQVVSADGVAVTPLLNLHICMELQGLSECGMNNMDAAQNGSPAAEKDDVSLRRLRVWAATGLPAVFHPAVKYLCSKNRSFMDTNNQ